jgi:hypothetical protein
MRGSTRDRAVQAAFAVSKVARLHATAQEVWMAPSQQENHRDAVEIPAVAGSS